ncbi:MAG: DUF420 domain-containing protein [Planctomycetes bacterium]|nr:DUF420 domain-containing protein [Planctomycetota bacterium]
MIPLAAFPSINAALNATCALLLLAGLACIRRKRVAAHRACMVGACAVSALFLASYLWYHAHHGSEPYRGTGAIRTVYFAVLISHTVLAASVPFLAGFTLARALRGNFPRHVRIARWTLPIWLYVSVTGVVVYAMLYHGNPGGEAAPPAPR